MDDQLLEILTAPPTTSESLVESQARKERILGMMFGRMGVVECRGMWLRLSRVREGDRLSETFARFPSAMRERLCTYLVDDRRLKEVAARTVR